MFSHNFVDYADKQEPFKRSAAVDRIGMLKVKNGFDIDISLTYHEASFDDELIDPLQHNDQTYGFLSTSF